MKSGVLFVPSHQKVYSKRLAHKGLKSLSARISVCVFVLWLSAFTYTKTPQKNIPFYHLIENNKDLGNIGNIVQDHNGFIWIGTLNGLVRFDGYDQKHYKHDTRNPGSISNDNILGLAIDIDGKLWIGTANGLNLYDEDLDRFYHFYHDKNNNSSLSHNTIDDVYVSKRNDVWVGTINGLNRFDRKSKQFIRYPIKAQYGEGLSGTNVRAIDEDGQGNIWIGTARGGLNKFDIKTKRFTHYYYEAQSENKGAKNELAEILVDTWGEVWVGTFGGGLYRFDIERERFSHVPYDASGKSGIPSTIIWDIYEDSQRNIWVLPDSAGIQWYDRKNDSYFNYAHDPDNNKSLSNNVNYVIFEDQSTILWVGSATGDIDLFNFNQTMFENYYHIPDKDLGLRYKTVLSFTETAQGGIWIGTEGGLNYVEHASGQFKHYYHKPDDVSTIPGNAVTSLLSDSKGRLWVGTWGGGISRFDSGNKSFIRYPDIRQNPNGLNGDRVWSIAEDHTGRIWVGTENGGLNYYDEESRGFKLFSFPSSESGVERGSSIWKVYEDSRRNLWVGAHRGLLKLDPTRNKTEFYNPIHSSSRNYGTVKSIWEDVNKDIWIGTQDAGLNRFNVETETFTHYLHDSGLVDNSVNAILEDDNGNLWLGTEGGLVRFNPNTEVFSSFDYRHGLFCHSFPRYGALKKKSGELIFGCDEGYTIFNPQNINESKILPRIVFTDLTIFNQSVKPYDDEKILTKAIENTGKFKLQHKHSVFSISYAALAYNISHTIEYAYRLEGFDIDWNYVGKRRISTYTNLSPGNYTFRVKSSDGMGKWLANESRIDIVVLPPWWRSTLAYIVYALAFIGGIYSIIRSLQNKVIAERERVKQLEEINALKDQFLANTSHELRTPLNGIIGIAESMRAGAVGELSELAKYNLSMIVACGSRLANLVNEVLDFSLMRENKIVLDKQPVSTFEIAELVVVLSQSAVQPDGPEVRNKVPSHLPLINADPDRIQQILHHLVDNALKFTKSGSVIISAQNRESINVISVTDTGRGIPKNKLGRIFESFEQIESSDTREKGGTGLGLAVVRHLVELHGGIIIVESKEGEGSTFSFSIPLSESDTVSNIGTRKKITNAEYRNRFLHTTPSMLSNVTPPAPDTNTLPRVDSPESHAENNKLKMRVMVVDDEAENRLVLTSYLELDGFHVTSIESGKEALFLLKQGEQFDLVLLDIMMPNLSGYEVCREIRRLHSPFALPILFLTAKNQVSDLVKGFDVGGNDFLVKPVNKDEIRVRITATIDYLIAFRRAKSSLVSDEIDEKIHAPIEPPIFCDKNLSTIEPRYTGQEKQQRVSALQSRTNKARILIVDDEPVNRLVLANYLQLDHYDVEQVESGMDALDFFKQTKQFDLVLLDIMMPKLSGYEVCRKLRERFPAYILPIIFLTAKNQVSDLVEGFDAGGNDFLTKPVNKDELSSRVKFQLSLLKAYLSLI